MATVLESLKGINAYPIPLRTIDEVAIKRGITLTDTATEDIVNNKDYNLALADLLLWLSLAPNISQGGQSFSFSDEQRTNLRNRAYVLYDEFDDTTSGINKTVYGYKGSRI